MKHIYSILKSNPKRTLEISGGIVVFLLLLIFTFHNEFMYEDSIIKIIEIDETYVTTQQGFQGQLEDSYKQSITAVVKNGAYKGETVYLNNTYGTSETASDRYVIGDKFFVKLTDTNQTLTASILYEKRDSYLFALFGLFVVLLLFFFRRQGIFTLLSLIINLATFFFALQFYREDAFFDWIWMAEVVVFCVVTLLLVSGFHKKTFGTILSALVAVGIVALLYYFVIYKDNSLPYDMLPNMVAYLPLEKLFFISTIFGLLGAVMDVAITINTSVYELVTNAPDISLKTLFFSVLEIGHDIMGTMVNVLFFSYLSGSLPLITLKVSNNYTLSTIINIDYIFDLLRFLVGSIGIVLAIPISGLIAILLSGKGLVRKHVD